MPPVTLPILLHVNEALSNDDASFVLLAMQQRIRRVQAIPATLRPRASTVFGVYREFRVFQYEDRMSPAKFDFLATVHGGSAIGRRGFKRQNDLLFTRITELETDFQSIHSKTKFANFA
ncbi:hypothetical protein JCGZ_20278 [Jatropha curcas]|uniref:Uncharacterized protein n=1 Tax=Jatropha curcas TaxID=180498 RepID=A0A067JTQ5_JATCU|nr:hypothetical protein JCGZ_20278 [Jatropha curcas]